MVAAMNYHSVDHWALAGAAGHPGEQLVTRQFAGAHGGDPLRDAHRPQGGLLLSRAASGSGRHAKVGTSKRRT